MDRRLKERLLGATVLVIAAVVLIPWLLRGKQVPDPVTQQLELPTPADSNGATKTVRLDVDREDPVASDPPPSSDEASTEAASAPAPDPAPVRADATAQQGVAAEAPVADTQSWAVQVGSFSNQSNAQRLADRLATLEYPAFVTRNVVEGRVMYRVKVGPETTRQAADQLAMRLKEDEHPARVVPHP